MCSYIAPNLSTASAWASFREGETVNLHVGQNTLGNALVCSLSSLMVPLGTAGFSQAESAKRGGDRGVCKRYSTARCSLSRRCCHFL